MSRFWHNLMFWWRGYRRVEPRHTPKILNMKKEEKEMPKFIVMGPDGKSTDITAAVEKDRGNGDSVKAALVKALKKKDKKK